jgi:hypothetical protein
VNTKPWRGRRAARHATTTEPTETPRPEEYPMTDTTAAPIDATELRYAFPAPEHQVITSPLATAAVVDFRQPIPVGIDVHAGPVTVPLAGSSLLIGGSMASGVSSAARNIATAAVLDPSVDIAIFDSMDMGDWDLLRPLAAEYAAGTRPATLGAIRAMLEEMLDEIDARIAALREAADHSGRASSETLATGFDPRLLVVAEVEHLTDDRRHGEAIAKALFEIARRGPRAGYALILTTHQPNQLGKTGSLLTAMRLRLAFHQPSYRSDALLGARRRDLGFDAGDLPRKPGVGILLTDGQPQVLRGYFLNEAELADACQRAAAIRGADAAHSSAHDATAQ